MLEGISFGAIFPHTYFMFFVAFTILNLKYGERSQEIDNNFVVKYPKNPSKNLECWTDVDQENWKNYIENVRLSIGSKFKQILMYLVY